MVSQDFKCPSCGKTMTFKLYGLQSIVKCEHCGHEYIVSKNFAIRMLEVLILISVGYYLLYGVFAPMDMNYFLQLAITIVVLYLVNLIFDVVMVKLIRYKKMYSLIEREYVKKK